MRNTILITGGAGFIGSHTTDLILAQGFNAIVLDDFSTGSKNNLPSMHAQLELITGDIATFDLLPILRRVDAVLHLTALTSVPQSIADPVLSNKKNTTAFLHLLQAIRNANKKDLRLVYASSAAVYGETKQLPCVENMKLDAALSPYALEKVHMENYAKLFDQQFGVKSLGLRYFNVYGERQDPQSSYAGVISKFIANYVQGLPITIYGDGSQSRDFISVHDIARANLCALQGNYGGVLNIATGIPKTLNQLVDYIAAVGGHPVDVNYTAVRKGDIAHSYADIQQAQNTLDFKANISLQEGLRELMQGRQG